MRSAEYDREQVLTNAMEVFRNKGYAKATMQELVAATGLHPGSLYGAFGNKRGLLLAAVDHYVDSRRLQRRELMAAGSPLAGIRAYLTHLANELTQCTCLVTRTVMELDQDDEVRERLARVYQDLEADLAGAVHAAIEQGQLPPAEVATLSAYLLVGVQGLVTFAQCRRDPALSMAVVEQLLAGLAAR
ncbi:TetR/AcrR family transcriptional regulator [Aeromonas diversa]|uniref:TetR/AcrR family transcriptional regulator n=1 Tax=Aeromonas diversa TaxID=502790 RepID=UPI003461D159